MTLRQFETMQSIQKGQKTFIYQAFTTQFWEKAIARKKTPGSLY